MYIIKKDQISSIADTNMGNFNSFDVDVNAIMKIFCVALDGLSIFKYAEMRTNGDKDSLYVNVGNICCKSSHSYLLIEVFWLFKTLISNLT